MDSYDIESNTKVVESNSEQDKVNIFSIRAWHRNGRGL